MLDCRSQVIRQLWDGSIALMFRLTHERFIVGYALGDDGMLFRGELITDCDEDRARHEALELADYWSGGTDREISAVFEHSVSAMRQGLDSHVFFQGAL